MNNPNNTRFEIVIASDHGGFRLKKFICDELGAAGHKAEDLGVHTAESVDYPDIARLLAERVLSGGAERGILICGSGIGMSIAANRFPGIRAALCHDEYTARMSRAHNNANVLVLGERVLGEGVAQGILDVWLTTAFNGRRHAARVEKLG